MTRTKDPTGELPQSDKPQSSVVASHQNGGVASPQTEPHPSGVIARLRELLAKATVGPWVDPPERGEWKGQPGPYLVHVEETGHTTHVGRFDYAGNRLADKRFIAAARNELPALLDWIEKMLPTVEMGAALHSDATSPEAVQAARNLLTAFNNSINGIIPADNFHKAASAYGPSLARALLSSTDRERKYREALEKVMSRCRDTPPDNSHTSPLSEIEYAYEWGSWVTYQICRSALPTEQEKGWLRTGNEARRVLEAARRILKWTDTTPGAEGAKLVARACLDLAEQTALATERFAQAAEAATLPEGYKWGADAMEQFNFGKARAAAAIRSALEQDKCVDASLNDGHVKAVVAAPSDELQRWWPIETAPRFKKLWCLHDDGSEDVAEWVQEQGGEGWQNDDKLPIDPPLFWRGPANDANSREQIVLRALKREGDAP